MRHNHGQPMSCVRIDTARVRGYYNIISLRDDDGLTVADIGRYFAKSGLVGSSLV